MRKKAQKALEERKARAKEKDIKFYQLTEDLKWKPVKLPKNFGKVITEKDYEELIHKSKVLERKKKIHADDFIVEVENIIKNNTDCWQPIGTNIKGKKKTCFIIEETTPFFWRINPQWVKDTAKQVVEFIKLFKP